MSGLQKFLLFAVVVAVIGVGAVAILGNKKNAFETQLLIERPIDTVFPYLYQPDLRRQWQAAVIEITPLGNTGELAGARYQEIIDYNGKPLEFQSKVVRYQGPEVSSDENPRRAISFQVNNATRENIRVLQLEQIEPDVTRFVYRYRTANAGLGVLLNFFENPGYQERIASEARALKSLVESLPRSNTTTSDGEPPAGTDEGDSSNEEPNGSPGP